MNQNLDKSVDQGAETEGFYSRWSKRKAQQRSSQQAESQAELSKELSKELNSSLQTAADTQTCPVSNEEKVLLCDKDMPDLDSLDEDSDYSGFLSPGVSEGLRKLALRKLFQGQGFNICDGLDDYDEEFTSFEKLGDIVTADMRFQLQQEAERKLQAAAEYDAVSDENDAAVLDEVCSEGEENETRPALMPDETAAADEDSDKVSDKDSDKVSIESIEQSALTNNEKLA